MFDCLDQLVKVIENRQEIVLPARPTMESLRADFEDEKKSYRTRTGRDLVADLDRFGKKNGGEWEVPARDAVAAAVCRLLGAPNGATVEPQVTAQTGSAWLTRDLLAGTVSYRDKSARYLIDFRREKVFLNEKEAARKDVAAALDALREAHPLSTSSAPHASLAMLGAIERVIGSRGEWTPPAAGTEAFRRLSGLKPELDAVRPFVSTEAERGGVERVNKFLRDRKFDIQLRSSGNPNEVAAASAFDLKVLWKVPGTQYPIHLPEQKIGVPGVWMKKPLSYYTAPGHPHPIVELETQSGERFFLTRFETKLNAADPFAAADAAAPLAAARKKIESPGEYRDGVQFPMAGYERKGSMDWMIGARTKGEDGTEYVLAQAVFAHRFRLNELGARAEAANAALAISEAPRTLVINGPYLAWLETGNGAAKPVIPFAVHITEDHMKEPAGLD